MERLDSISLLKDYINIDSLKSKGFNYLLLYFYPKDNTPGCTIEAKEFSELKLDFEKLGVYIVGVSKDSKESHQRFKEKHNLIVDLISDTEQTLIKAFEVLALKNRFGKEYYGVVRSTFLIDLNTLKIVKEWRNVKAKGHAYEVLEFVRDYLSNTHNLQKFTRDQVAYHNKEDDCWVIVNNKVYDVTKLLDTHSGGKEVILPYCGQDATAAFEGKPHSEKAYKKLEEYLIGALNPEIVNNN